jgi:hypothetical protein
VQVLSQQRSSAQLPPTQSPLALQVWPCVALHAPVLSQVPARAVAALNAADTLIGRGVTFRGHAFAVLVRHATDA